MAERRNDLWAIDPASIPKPNEEAETKLWGYVPASGLQPVTSRDVLRLSVVKVLAYRKDQELPQAIGTAVFIDNQTLLTVGHVIFDPYLFDATNYGGYAYTIQVFSPFLSIQADRTSRMYAAGGWTGAQNPEADLAIFRLNQPVGGVAELRPEAFDDATLQDKNVHLYGFPLRDYQLMEGAGTCVHLEPNLLYHTADGTDGESGSPIILDRSPRPPLAGLHRAGPGATPDGVPPSVSAFRFTTGALRWVRDAAGKI